ncbi:hypothetical protein K0M31_011906 [Melipona bicolor]|uniref:Uncharacterized protein n=1 Tax=Melipona bicolor TaxID=60889 RepID=A0AA40GAQ6_9HYME|nr:hypothetical protein K0M31_011906 [Melipona bicolor]
MCVRTTEGHGIRETWCLICQETVRYTNETTGGTFRVDERVQAGKSPSKWKISTSDSGRNRVDAINRHIHINRSFLGVVNQNARPEG